MNPFDVRYKSENIQMHTIAGFPIGTAINLGIYHLGKSTLETVNLLYFFSDRAQAA